jgi:hypothetical protein
MCTYTHTHTYIHNARGHACTYPNTTVFDDREKDNGDDDVVGKDNDKNPDNNAAAPANVH